MIATPECPPACVTLLAVEQRHASGCTHAAPPATAWCPDCRRTRTVEDQFTASTMTRAGEEEYGVTVFDCGHEAQGPGRIVAVAPGAPYAGSSIPTAPTSRPRDLRVAREHHAAVRDPWGEEA